MKKAFSVLAIACLVAATFVALQPISKANFMPMPTPQPAIVIKNDGTVSPASAPITRIGDIYSLTGSIVNFTLAIERDNVTVDGSGYALLGKGNYAGVFVQERNGVTLRNLDISGFSYGILFTWFYYGDTSRQRSNTVANNKLSNNSYGIYINDFSSDNIISENNVTNNTHGIYLGSCSNNFLRNNRMDNNTFGFFVYGTSSKANLNDVDQSNTIDGKPVIYWIDQQGKQVPSRVGFLALINCNNMTIQNLDLSNKGQGMLLVALTNSQILNNRISSNDNGIWLIQSQNNTIFENIFSDNKYDALYISSSSNNRITRNNFTDNGLSGTPAAQTLGATGRAAIWLTDSSDNIISENIIEGNGEGISLQQSQNNLISTNYIANTNGTAIHFYGSTGNKITANNVANNNDWAIKLWSSNQNNVYANFLANNSLGILLDAAAENKITENTIANNTGWAIQLKSSSDKFMSSANNTIILNNFINNQQGEGLDVSIPGIWTYPGGYVAGVGNIWDNGHEGNYWSDYLTRYPNASEIPATGTGNTPFRINENNVDNHPLMEPKAFSPPPASDSVLGILDFEEAAVAASNTTTTGKWQWSGYRRSSSFQNAPLVSADGLISGHLEWNQNGSLFEADHPSGQVKAIIERFEGLNESETYYVWALTLMDHSQIWIDARNGDLLTGTPSRNPGTMQFDVAVRITQAAEPKINLWNVTLYERLANYTWASGTYRTDGDVVGHFLKRSPTGTFTEEYIPVGPVPTPGPSPPAVLRIQASNDADEYIVWEIKTKNQTFYIDERDGAIRYVIANANIPDLPVTQNPSPSIPEFPAWIILPIAASALGLLVYFRKRRG